MKEIFKKLKKQLDNDSDDTKRSIYNRENETLEEYNGRQVLEILQNIDDQKSKKALIKLDTINKIVIFANEGVPFNEDGVKSLMIPDLSPKDKKTSIGNKGLGFRSLLNWIGSIYVKSQGLSIEFSEENKNRQIKNGVERAILSAPEWIDQDNQREWINSIEFSNEYVTYIAVQYEKNYEKKILEQIYNVTEELLFFINNIEEIKIEITNRETKILKKANWEIKEKIGIIDDENVLKQRKYKNQEVEYTLKVAIPPNSIEKKKVNKYLFSYFPTKIDINFPVVVHATFDLNSSRNTINDTPVNRYILDRLVEFLTEVISERLKCNIENCEKKECLLDKCPDYSANISTWKTYQFLNIDENGRNKNNDLKEYRFFDKIKKWKETAEIYPTIDNGYKKLGFYSYYYDEFSDFMTNYTCIYGDLLKKGDKFNISEDLNIAGYYKPKIQFYLNKVSKRIKNIDERIKLIQHIEKLRNISPNSFKDGEKLKIFVNQNNKFKEKMFWYDDIFEKIIIPEFLELDFLNKKLYEKISTNWKDQEIFEIFDIHNDFYKKIINSNQSIKIRLKILYEMFLNGHAKPKLKFEKITGKYIRDERLLKIFSDDDIIEDYTKLGINTFNRLTDFLIWLDAKKFDLSEIIKIVVEKNNRNNIADIKWSLKTLFILNDEIESFKNFDLYAINKLEKKEKIENLYLNTNALDNEIVVADKEELGLEEFSETEVEKFLEKLGVKKANYENIAHEKLKKLKNKDISTKEVVEILKSLIKIFNNNNLDTKLSSDIYLFGKRARDLFLKDSLTERYFPKDLLIFQEIEENGIIYEENEEFFKWLEMKKPLENDYILKIFENNTINEEVKIEDLFKIFKINPNIERPDILFKIKTKSGEKVDIKQLYLNNTSTRFCQDSKIINVKITIENEAFFKWLGAKNPSKDYLKNRYIEILSLKEKDLSIADRKDIIRLLESMFKNKRFESLTKPLYLLTNKDNIEINNKIYLKNKLSENYYPENLIAENLDLEFLEWLGVKEADPFEVIKILLKRDKIDLVECFRLWKEYGLNSKKIDFEIKLKNKYGNFINSKKLFLKKSLTESIYEKCEIVADFKVLGFGVDDLNPIEIEEFLNWLGVNSYTKEFEENSQKKIYKLNRIGKLEFYLLVELMIKSNSLLIGGALSYLRNIHKEYKYWIINNQGIDLLKPKNIEYNKKNIDILSKFGVKHDLDSENSLEILNQLPFMDPNGKIANKIYKLILDKNIKLNNKNFKICTEQKEYIDNFKVSYLQNSGIPEFIMKKYNFIDLQMNLDSKKVIETFNLKELSKFNYKVIKFTEAKNYNKFLAYFEELKPYILADIIGELSEYDQKKGLAKKLKNLEIKIGVFKCFVEDGLSGEYINMEKYEMVYSKDKEVYYFFANELEENYLTNERFEENIKKIFLDQFQSLSNKVEKVMELFTYKRFDKTIKRIKKEYKIEIDEMKEMLNIKDEVILLEEKIYCKNEISKNDYLSSDIVPISSQEIQDKEKNNCLESQKMVLNKFIHNSFDKEKQKENENFVKEKTSNKLIYMDEDVKCNLAKKNNINYSNVDIDKVYDPKIAYERKNKEYYNSLNNRVENQRLKDEAGKWAEDIVKKYLEDLKNKKIISEYNHVSGYVGGNDTLGYDFTYSENGSTHYVEVKNYNSQSYYFTKNELDKAFEFQDKYHLYLVDINQIVDIINPFGNQNRKIIDKIDLINKTNLEDKNYSNCSKSTFYNWMEEEPYYYDEDECQPEGANPWD